MARTQRKKKNRHSTLAAPVYEVVSSSSESVETQFAHFAAVMEDWAEGEDEDAFLGRIPEVVAARIRAILDLAEPFDALDLLELQRQYEFPARMDDFHESTSDQSIAAVDLLAVILLARGASHQSSSSSGQNPASVTGDIHHHARVLLALGGLQIRASGHGGDAAPLAELAGESASHLLTVRNWAYVHVQDDVNGALLGSERVKPAVEDGLGFTYTDYLAVRLAVAAHRQLRAGVNREAIAALGRRKQAGETLTDDFLDEGRLAFDQLFGHPGSPASFILGDISGLSGVSLERTLAVLELFTVVFGEEPVDVEEAVRRFLSLRHEVFGRQLVRRDNRYLALGTPIGTDVVRQAIEAKLKGTKAWNRFQKARGDAAEAVAVDRLKSLLGTEPSFVNLKYLVPANGTDLGLLEHAAAVDQPTLVKEVESDALFVIDDVAICLEVKAGAISAAARRGDVRRLANDLRDTVADAVSQAERLRQLITTNGGLWTGDRTWIDLSAVREVHSVVINLDDLGVLGIAVDELARAGLISEPQLAWITSLHDLTVIMEVLDEPSEFLLYLRRRTDPGVVTHYQAVDELDLLMLFLDGDLYVEADPDEVACKHPEFGPPSAAARARFRKQPEVRRISTLTDPLDAWVYGQEGSGDPDAPKPQFGASQEMRDFVGMLRELRRPGWLRTGADLLALASEVQSTFVGMLKQVALATRADRQDHKGLHTYPDNYGFPGVLVGTPAAHETTENAFQRLYAYGALKKHQLKLDRLTTILLDANLKALAGAYDSEPWQPDPELDRLVEQSGLKARPDNRDKPPPSARRATRRLSRSKNKR